MRDNNSDTNINNNYGGVFNAPISNVTVNNNVYTHNKESGALYESVPIWRSPITMGILSWISVIIGVAQLFPLYKIIEPLIDIFIKNESDVSSGNNAVYVFALLVLLTIFITAMGLRSIAKNQTRHPLFKNYAISGLGKKITVEKIRTKKCPQCGGEMIYYNKPVEWEPKVDSDGKVKYVVSKRVPALECKRNPKHWYEVDPAEERLE